MKAIQMANYMKIKQTQHTIIFLVFVKHQCQNHITQKVKVSACYAKHTDFHSAAGKWHYSSIKEADKQRGKERETS